jgi:hypothetical protein
VVLGYYSSVCQLIECFFRYIHLEPISENMAVSMILNRVFSTGVLFFFSMIMCAQESLIASVNHTANLFEQHSAGETAGVIIVDLNSNVQSYPSMEEEMDMYMELSNDQPKAFFFPNPSSGIVWLEHNLGKECKVIIRDSDGVSLYEAINHRTQKLDLNSFKTGEYLIELTNGFSTVTRSLSVRF